MTGADGCASALPVTHRDYVADIKRLGLAPIPVKKNAKVPSNKWADITIDNPADFTNHDGNIGIKLGEWDDPYAMFASYIFALDVDVKNGDGLSDLETLQAAHGPLPATWTATTPSGGKHLLFRTSTPVRNQQGAGNRLSHNIDIRGEGGFIVIAPSTINGVPYRWERSPWDTEIADAPDWLIDLLTTEPKKPEPKPAPSLPSLNSDSPADRLRAKWNWETELAADGWTHSHTQPNGDQMWARPDKPTSEGHSAVLHSDGAFVVWTTSVSALNTAGRPTVDGSARTLSPYDYYVAVRHHGSDREACAAINGDDWAIVKASSVPSDDGDKQPLGLELIDWKNVNDRPEALIEGLVYPGRWIAFFGGPKAGKSTLLIALSLDIARGYNTTAAAHRTPTRVLYVDAEMGRVDMLERLTAHGIPDPSTIPNWWATDLPHPFDTPEGAQRLHHTVKELAIDCVIIDGLNGAVAGNENDDTTWREFYKLTIHPMKNRGIAVITGDNSGKDPTLGQRGSSVKQDKPDANARIKKAENAAEVHIKQRRTAAYQEKTVFKIDNLDSTAYVTVTAVAKADPLMTSDAIAALDALGLPNDATNETCKAALRENGPGFRNDAIAAAVRRRKARDPFGTNTAEMGG